MHKWVLALAKKLGFMHGLSIELYILENIMLKTRIQESKNGFLFYNLSSLFFYPDFEFCLLTSYASCHMKLA